MRHSIFALLALCFCLLAFAGCDEELLSALRQYQAGQIDDDQMRAAFAAYQERKAAEDLALLERPAVAPVSVGLEEPCTALLDTSTRGLACLHCTHPAAAEQARSLALTLRASCLQDVAMNYLVDGTFDYDDEALRWQVDALTDHGRRFTIELYLTNGATQRRWKTTPIDAFGVRVSPEKFRERIQHDPEFQYGYQRIVQRVVPFIRYAQNKGARVILTPMLEDNLTNDAFAAMLRLTKDALPADVSAYYARNACSNCYRGTEDEVPTGVVKEVHSVSPYRVPRGGIITNDGQEYRLASEEVDGVEWTLEDLANLRDAASDVGALYLLWSARRQGLPRDLNRGEFLHPDNREYLVPSLEERRALVAHLRGER